MEVENRKNNSKIIILLMIFVLVMAIMALVLVYFTNEKFNTNVKNLLERISFLRRKAI